MRPTRAGDGGIWRRQRCRRWLEHRRTRQRHVTADVSNDTAARVTAASSSRRELVAERAARRTLHDGLVTSEGDVAAARSGDVEVGFAYEQRAKLGLAERAEELGEPAMCNVEFQRLLIVPAHLHRDVVLGDFGHGGVHGRPFAARAAIDAVGYGGEQLFRPAAQRLLDDRVSLLFPQFGTQRSEHWH